MKFALIDGIKSEATKGGRGICSNCKSELISKCGEFIINHWAHKGKQNGIVIGKIIFLINGRHI